MKKCSIPFEASPIPRHCEPKAKQHHGENESQALIAPFEGKHTRGGRDLLMAGQ